MPLHELAVRGVLNVGVGLIVMVKVKGVGKHPVVEGVIVISPVIGLAVRFVAVNDGISPVPLAPSPIAVFVLVQLKIVGTGPVTGITEVVEPLQKGVSAIGSTDGVGYDVIVPDADA